MMVIENKFEIGSIVYLKTDKEQKIRMVTGVLISPIGITYRIGEGATESWNYEIEIADEKDVLTATTN